MKSCVSFLLFLISFCYPAGARAGDSLSASGCSVSNTGYLTELAKEYERRTGVKVFVRGGGSVVGIEDLRNGKVDFAASCRMKEPGDPEDFDFIQVAWDALVFIVHKTNPVQQISLNDARDLYFGKITNWRQLGGGDLPVRIFISRPRKGLSGVEASTNKMVLQGKSPVESSNTVFVASTGIVEQMVEDDPNGFATTGFTSARKRDVKMLKVGGFSPTQKNIVLKKYSLMRPLFIIVPRMAKPEVKRFIDFVLSGEGQKFLSSQGVVSLHDVKEK